MTLKEKYHVGNFNKEYPTIDFILSTLPTKNQKGLFNELLISGNVHLHNIDTKVLNDHNPNYDIEISKDGKHTFIESKLDMKSEQTDNFYFEYWNYSHNRPTGINNSNLLTLYSHTFKRNGKWYFIINYRKTFIQILKQIKAKYPNKIKKYNNVYYNKGMMFGDMAYIVDTETFLSMYHGKVHEMKLAIRWY